MSGLHINFVMYLVTNKVLEVVIVPLSGVLVWEKI